jgi:hypothetical protein
MGAVMQAVSATYICRQGRRHGNGRHGHSTFSGAMAFNVHGHSTFMYKYHYVLRYAMLWDLQ